MDCTDCGIYKFGTVRVDPAHRTITIDGAPVKLGARAFDLLVALIERRDRVVSKHDLLDIVWPNVVVEENNLQVQIWALRKLLGPQVIATVPGRGYRFSATLINDRRARATPAAAPADRPSALPPGNVFTPPPPLYGRHAELEALHGLLEHHRLVSIVGAGGIGKTRVAQALAHARRGDYPGGVWLIELAALVDPQLVPASIAQTLSMQMSGGPTVERLAAALASEPPLLLVLDNCEHLSDAAGELVHVMLTRTSNVRLLVTSQERLRIRNEQVFRLGPLAVPAPATDDQPLQVAHARQYGAVQLFCESVKALDPRFVLSEQNVEAVADLCRQLDGLALAIELAAARVPSLGVHGVRDRLAERLRMLTAGTRDAPRRHQTLREALEWSHGLLDEQARTVFRRMGIFSGGCTIEAVQQVVRDEQLDEWAVLDAVARLVDRSLVVADGDDEPRYRMLESARLHALDKLVEAGEVETLARRHATTFASYFKRKDDALFAGVETDDGFIAARAADFDNLRAALAWALSERGDPDVALELLVHTAPHPWSVYSHGECETWLSTLERRFQEIGMNARQAAWLHYVRILWGFLGIWHATLQRAELGFTTEERGFIDDRRFVHCAPLLARIFIWRGQPERAAETLAQARALEQPEWPAWLSAMRQVGGMFLIGDPQTLSAHEEAMTATLERLRAEGNATGRSAFRLTTELAALAMLKDEVEAAAGSLRQLAESGRRQRRDEYCMFFVYEHLGAALAELGRLDEARDAIQALLPLLRRTGGHAMCASMVAFHAARSGRHEKAARLLAAGQASNARTGWESEPLERRTVRKVQALLAAECDAKDLERWTAEGAVLDDAAIATMVMDQA